MKVFAGSVVIFSDEFKVGSVTVTSSAKPRHGLSARIV